MADIGISIGDTLGVVVTQGPGEEEETFAEVVDPFTYAAVQDPDVEALVYPESTECLVILSAL